MTKARSILFPASLAALFAACAALLCLAGDAPVSAVASPELRPAPEPYVAVTSRYVAPDPPDVRVGDFDRPEGVPDYRVLQTDRSERDGARGATLVVDTTA